MNQIVDLKVREEDGKTLSFCLPTEKLNENVDALIHQQNYSIAYLQEIGNNFEEKFRELSRRITSLQIL